MMSGSNQVVIILERGQSGLGFNIKGGKDDQLFPGDSSIYVAKIKLDGAAAKDKRLQVGDKILQVNNIQLDNVTHQFAVEAFLKAGDTVQIVIIPGEETKALARETKNRIIQSRASPVWSSTAAMLSSTAVVVGLAAAVAMYVRHK